MLVMKIKETTKLQSRGKCDLLHQRLSQEEINQTQSKADYKDYVTEIFAGLSWLG